MVYFRDGEEEFLIKRKKGIDLDAKNAWRLNGAKPFQDLEYDEESAGHLHSLTTDTRQEESA